MSCNCNNNFNDNFKGGGCGCGGCSDGFKGRNKERKRLQKEEGLTRQEARTVVQTKKKATTNSAYMASNPAMSVVFNRIKNMTGGMSPAMATGGNGEALANGNPNLQSADKLAEASVQANPSMNTTTVQNNEVNPSMNGTTSQVAANPNMNMAQPQPEYPRQPANPTAVAEDVEVEEVEEEENPADNNAENKPDRKKMRKVWFIVGAIVALLLIVLLLFFLFRKKPE